MFLVTKQRLLEKAAHAQLYLQCRLESDKTCQQSRVEATMIKISMMMMMIIMMMMMMMMINLESRRLEGAEAHG